MKIEKANSEEEAPIYGDILELIFSYVPLVDLVTASQVSRAWNDAVSSSLRHVNRLKPWLIVHSQSTRPPYAASAHAYDQRSGDWFQIRHNKAPIKYSSNLRSSHSSLLFALSPNRFAFSTDALRLRWSHADAPPLVSRTDPIVAMVGDRAVVAGGACDFGDDPIPVEIYDLRARAWSACDSMPALLVDAGASTALSIAVLGGEMIVGEKSSGLAYAFDPAAVTWRGAYDLRCRRRREFCTVVESVGDGGLVAVGMVGSPESVETVILTKFGGESFEVVETLGEMPKDMVEKLVGESSHVSSVSIAAKGSFVFMLNQSDPSVVIQCEIVDGGCRWASVRNKAIDGGDWIARRLLIGCADVTIVDLRKAMAAEEVTFAANVAD